MNAEDLERRLANAPAGVPLDRELLRSALRRRAQDEGLVDVAYGQLDSPVGTLTVYVTPRGVASISYPDDAVEDQLERLAARVSPRIFELPERTDAVRRELDAYFARRLSRFSTRVDWRLVSGFAIGVLRATARVPYGQVTTYRDVATAAGSPRGARAAGNALNRNPIPIIVPCHRVLHADGGLGGYAGGLERKEFLLRLEGAGVG
jgi:methylated-DNA-[protein]-cysteine S-methyltransferase